MIETICISVPKTLSREEIQAIRDKYKDKRVVLFISGEEDIKDNLYKLLKARIDS